MVRIKALFLATLMSASLLLGSLPAAAADYDDYDEIVNTGIDLSVPKTLTVASPAKANITTTAATYTISGSSDPEKNLTINGAAVEQRGELGSYGKQVQLQLGKNVFHVNNGGTVQTVTITREKAPEAGKTDKITSAKPTADDVTFAGEYKLRCTAPSGAEVTATVQGQTIPLEQVAATAEEGVPAIFSGIVTLEAGDIPSVTYKLTWKGQSSSVSSTGAIRVFAADSKPTVTINQNSTTVYEQDDTSSNFVAMLNQGAADEVVDFGETLAKLSLGGWVKKEFLDFAEEDFSVDNTVKSVRWEVNDRGEYLHLEGSVASAFKSYMNSEKVALRFNRMKGLSTIDLGESSLFEKAELSSNKTSSTIELYLKTGKALLGYDVRYNEDGTITVFFNEKPVIDPDSEKPLDGLTIILDPGHGGADPGALGALNGKNAPMEDEITMAHAIAAQKRLEKLGARAIISVPKNLPASEKFILHERVQLARDEEADFFLSLHCNSLAGESGLKAKGSEVYYYENLTQPLAEEILTLLTQSTERNLRGCYYSNYFVTRNTTCPGLLLEMGFISNPVEYDQLRQPDSLYHCANALADGVLSFLGQNQGSEQ